MQQNTIDWLKWRADGLGGSDAPIIMEVSKFMTPLQLWEEKLAFQKTGKVVEKEANYAQEKGHRLEPKARAHFELLHDIDMPPALIQDDKYPFLKASLDGLNTEIKAGLEIKYMGKDDHDAAGDGVVPEKYIPQIQHQIYVGKLDLIYFLSFNEDGKCKKPAHIIEVGVDLEYQKKLLIKELEFWQMIKEEVPPALTDRDYKIIKDPAAKILCAEYARLDGLIDSLTEQKDAVKEKVLAISKEKRFKCGALKVIEIVRKGNVDYKKIPELKGLDLEQYRGKPVRSVRIDISNE